MKLDKITVALDSAIDKLGYNVGHKVAFSDGLPTIDDGLAFYVSQLSNVEAKIYETKYRKIVYQDFVPVDMSDPDWIDNVTYFSYDAVTSGKFIGANARDLPRATINKAKTVIPVFYGGNSYGYSLDELRKSQQTRIPLDTTEAQASFRGFQEHAQKVAFFGDADLNITGLFNNANVQSDNSTVDWATASGQEIVADMNGLLIKIWQNSAETHVPDHLLLPSDQWAIISNKRMDSGTDTTVLQFFKMNNLYKDLTGGEITIQPNFELKTAGAASAPRMMAYEKTDENLGMKMPFAWRSLAPQMTGLQVDIPAEYKFGGTFFRYPGSAAYRDFI